MGRQCGVITSTVCKDYRGKERKGSFWGTLPQGESSQERIRGWGRGSITLAVKGQEPNPCGVLSPLGLAGVRLGLGSAPQTARDPTWDSTKKDVLGKGKCGILWVGDLSPSILRGFSFQTGV